MYDQGQESLKSLKISKKINALVDYDASYASL